MDDRKRSELIDALAKSVYGEGGKKSDDDSGISVKFERSTGTIRFILSGTEYSTSRVAEASEYFKNPHKMKKPGESVEKMYNEIAYVCINEILRQFNATGPSGQE
ncbi:MAG: hypothetical protein K6E33_03000 [Lachnospiraceae bacterium]|nr:hypothetical protein [Lachnospiraceae bacterium]